LAIYSLKDHNGSVGADIRNSVQAWRSGALQPALPN
jgi:hypothetical protein